MANKSSLVITATDITTGRAQQKTITDVNPQASSSHLKTWAQMTASLTKDNYIKSKRVDVRELDDQANPARSFGRVDYFKIENGTTQYPTLNLNEPIISLRTDYATASPSFGIRITTPYDGTAPVVNVNSDNWYLSKVEFGFRNSGTTDNVWTVRIKSDNTSFEAESFNISIDFPETFVYQSSHWDIAVNVSDPT